jgi:hypothetical protein
LDFTKKDVQELIGLTQTQEQMKTLIRKGVFETNSSSSHSISLASEDKDFIFDTIYPDQNGTIRLTGGWFQWDWFKHNDAITKANYAATDFQNNSDLIDLLNEVIMEQTGATEILHMIGDSSIDHDSVGTTPRTKEELRNFIFNKNSWLFGGNDNESPDPTFYDVPEFKFVTPKSIIKGSGQSVQMIVPKYKYELVVDGLEKTTKYKEYPTDEELSNGVESLTGNLLMNDSGSFLDPEITGSIMFQISNNEDYFKKSFWVNQDYSDGTIIMVKENQFRQFEDELDKKGLFKDKNWKEKSNILRSELLNRPDIAKKVSFTLREI